MKLDDGGGSGTSAIVTSEGRLETYSVIEPESLHVNEEEGQTYSAVTSRTPSGAADCFLYIKNNSDEDLIICCMRLWTASAESVQVKLGDTGTATSGNTLTPVNRNGGSGNLASATVEDGVDITGLSGGSVVDEVFGSTTMNTYEWSSGLIVPKNRTASFYAVTGGVALKATVAFYFH